MAVHGAARLDRVDPDLCVLVAHVGAFHEIVVVQGARSIADEQADIYAGRSHLHDPRNSLHVLVPGVRENALAVDLARWSLNWNDHQAFVDLSVIVKDEADKMGMRISWGGDWVHPFDFDHYERVTP